jgi:four helix bundle protein
MQDVEKLNVYKDAKQLTKELYAGIKSTAIPFKLQDQILGSMGSVAANLAEFASMTNENQKKAKMITCIGECSETIFWYEIVMEDTCHSLETKADIQERLQKLKASLIALYKALGVER